MDSTVSSEQLSDVSAVSEDTGESVAEPADKNEKIESLLDEIKDQLQKTESWVSEVEKQLRETESSVDEVPSRLDEIEAGADDTASQPENSGDFGEHSNSAPKWVFKDGRELDNSSAPPFEPVVQTIPNVDKRNGKIVVMLDPGHDDDEDCSARNHPNLGVNEQSLNLEIGLACYNRLLQYDGVIPCMTRYDGQCPNPEKSFAEDVGYDCIHKRAYLAELAKADVFVSIHCNAMTSDDQMQPPDKRADGVEVYVTRYSKFAEESTKLANTILKHITSAVDFSSRGVHSEEKVEKGTYDDGTIKDKLYLISFNIDYGRPSLVVEHGFMDNEHDNAILRDENNLKLLGEADADAIAEYYGLKLK